MIKKIIVLFAFTVALFFGDTHVNAEQNGEILVSAAADLTRAFKEIGEIYERETGNKVVFNFGSSGMLAKQIEGGAPVDLFASADRRYIENLDKKGLVVPETKKIYAIGRIVLVVPKGRVKLDSISELLRPAVNKIAIANPGHAPYGVAAKEAMEKAGVWEKIKSRIIYGENIRQTLQYVEVGEVDAAIVALSLCIGSDISYVPVPQQLYSPIEQSMAVIKGAKNEKAARDLADYISGPKGKAVLEKFGFTSK